MRSHHALLLAGLAVVALPLRAAEPPPVILEQAIEARASAVLLPSSANGMLVVTGCTGCAPQSLVTTARTRYLADSVPVTLAALRAALASAPGAGLVVFYDAKSREVTRVMASGPLVSPATAPPRARHRGARP